jgi:hypothetical protein
MHQRSAGHTRPPPPIWPACRRSWPPGRPRLGVQPTHLPARWPARPPRPGPRRRTRTESLAHMFDMSGEDVTSLIIAQPALLAISPATIKSGLAAFTGSMGRCGPMPRHRPQARPPLQPGSLLPDVAHESHPPAYSRHRRCPSAPCRLPRSLRPTAPVPLPPPGKRCHARGASPVAMRAAAGRGQTALPPCVAGPATPTPTPRAAGRSRSPSSC